MTWIADLAPCTYFDVGPPRSNLVAVGWLGEGHPFSTGVVTRRNRAALAGHLLETWQPITYRGWHDCELCPSTSGDVQGWGISSSPRPATAISSTPRRR